MAALFSTITLHPRKIIRTRTTRQPWSATARRRFVTQGFPARQRYL